MPRKPNYQFEKRQKELDRQARKAEKLQRRQQRSEGGEGGEGAENGTDESGTPEGGALPQSEG